MNVLEKIFRKPEIASKSISKREGWMFVDVRGADGELVPAARKAMASVHKGVALAAVVLSRGKLFISEHPIGHGAGALMKVR